MLTSLSIEALTREWAQVANPKDYFNGRTPEHLCLPHNVLAFTRRSASALRTRSYGHWIHHRYVLITNLRTPGTINIEGLDWDLHPGQAILLFPNQYHSYSKLADASALWLLITFELDTHAAPDLLRDRLLTVDDEYLALTKRILAYFHAGDNEAGNQALVLEVASLLNHLRRQAAGESLAMRQVPTRAKRRSLDLIDRIQRLVHAHADSFPTSAGIAAELGVAPEPLSAIVRRHFGVSLGTYLKNHRLAKAVLLMRNPNLSLSTIAFELGFASQAAFSRFFTHATGIAPNRYRRGQLGGPARPPRA